MTERTAELRIEMIREHADFDGPVEVVKYRPSITLPTTGCVIVGAWYIASMNGYQARAGAHAGALAAGAALAVKAVRERADVDGYRFIR